MNLINDALKYTSFRLKHVNDYTTRVDINNAAHDISAARDTINHRKRMVMYYINLGTDSTLPPVVTLSHTPYTRSRSPSCLESPYTVV